MMTEFGFNSQYMTKSNKPWFPVMGEIHYTRYPKKYWKEALYKMKAGGVEVISTYAIWIHHEEIEGEYDFTGNRDLRSFVEMCKECGLYLILRIGPWVHGEVRNGGFPDWLLQKGYNLRSNDTGYLAEVEKYDRKLFEQVKGLLLKEGGPIIGLQIENELGHCGGAYGEDGENHMKTLHRIALEIGFDVPIYTATGWGGAVTGGLLPVMGGYCEAPWDQRRTEIEPSGNYIFTYERNDHNIGSDYGLGVGVTFDYAKFPYLTAELGGGMQVTHHRRPIAEAEDIGAMSLVKMGSGVNLLGYYMYHGGTNPKGKRTTLQESRETGYPNDLPELNYDFCAPIREYGQVSDTLKEIKLYAMFIQDFGSELCEMTAYIPENNPILPTNLTDIRYSIRHNGHSGYLFINNYQRRYQMEAHDKVSFKVDLCDETITFPNMDIKDKDYYFLPFHMQIGGAVLKSAAVTPLCILKNETKTYLFYGDKIPAFDIEGDLGDTKLITLSREDARNAWKVKYRKEHLIISKSAILQTEQGLEIIGTGALQIKVYPDFETTLESWIRCENDGEFTVYRKITEQVVVRAVFSQTDRLVSSQPKSISTHTFHVSKDLNHLSKNLNHISKDKENISEKTESIVAKTANTAATADKMMYDIELDIPEEQIEDCFLTITYQGDKAKLYLEGELVADHFYTGRDWEIGLKRFDFPKMLQLEIDPLRQNDQVYLQEWPTMVDGIACRLSKVSTEVEYKEIIFS